MALRSGDPFSETVRARVAWQTGRSQPVEAHLEKKEASRGPPSDCSVEPILVGERGLRLDDALQLDDLLLDRTGDVRHDVLVEAAVVLVSRLPDRGRAEASSVLGSDVEDEARLLLDRTRPAAAKIVVVCCGESIDAVRLPRVQLANGTASTRRR